jgi:lipopolysaccharide/colanic/teichoic acid biosynthesis glycosyltransferase
MARRLFDLSCASIGIVLAAPLLLIVSIGIKLTNPGPVLYRASRVGVHGIRFEMYKFRTMRVTSAEGSAITSEDDSRIYPLGRLLRKLKIDELPQLLNIVSGDMSIVGPRPEDPRIVVEHYTEEFRETLEVKPGLASPGSIFNYTHGQKFIPEGSAEEYYAETLLPVKMALDRVYVERQSLWYDLRICFRTLSVIIAYAAGRREFPYPPELADRS